MKIIRVIVLLFCSVLSTDGGFVSSGAKNNLAKFSQGPRFTISPKDVVYDTRSSIKTIRMECRASAWPRPFYLWRVMRMLSDNPVNLSDPAIKVTNGILTIDDPKEETHSGQYYCIAGNLYGKIKGHAVGLKFAYLNDFPKAKRDQVHVSAYTGVAIECLPPKNNYNALQYAWYKDSPRDWVRPNVKRHTFVSSDGKLYFESVTKEDQGNYTCVVSTPQTTREGKSSQPIPLVVREAVGSEQEPVIAHGFPKSFPFIQLVGQDIRIECMAFANSGTGLTYTWSRVDGSPMPSRAQFSDRRRVMTIPNVQLGHSGIYRCSVSRQLERSTFGDIRLVIEAIPYFTTPLLDRRIDENADLAWQCKAGGLPEPSYSWYVNATPFDVAKYPPQARSRYQVKGNTLTISKVQFMDAGMYQCAADNGYGMRFTSGQLRVSRAGIF